MDLKERISEALHLPSDSIAYFVSRELSRLYRDKTIIEGAFSSFDLVGYAKAELCSIVGGTTQTRQLAPAPSQGPPHPPCAADASVTFYDAKITTPITVCSPLSAGDSLVNALFFRDAKATRFKLTDPGIFQSLANLKNASLAPSPYVCATGNGPWSARIISERGCIGTCSPHNHLFVVGVPNSVEFDWFGALNRHPAGFEFVGTPTQTDHQSFGQCHGGT